MVHMENTVTISQEEYASLLDDRRMLLALENAGVDNWSGYEHAQEEYFGPDEDEDEY